ncbi:MAG: site-specific integrase, partial [Nocardiopsaceae bacterium]|nr:site-specific integrase [Nocardiopsaceae bacterium]
ERGLSEGTVASYEGYVRRFLPVQVGLADLRLDQLTAADVIRFVAEESERAPAPQLLATALRSVLRYLHVTGMIVAPLDWAVPSVATVRQRLLPRGVNPTVVASLLAGCDRRTTRGRRDYAILLLLARLGLRASEVAGILLGDINWRAGELLVHGKGGRDDVLPLPVDVGEALANYLERRSPTSGMCRTLFVLETTPPRPMSRHTVSVVLREACKQEEVPRVCPHRLRHTLASEMLRAGASLQEVAEVLRHHKLQTTAVYARVDRQTLRTVARPWPEVVG